MVNVKLWNVAQGRMVNYRLSADKNGEILAEYGDVDKDDYSFLKFPGDIDSDELHELFEKHNSSNKGVKALSEEELEEEQSKQSDAQELIDSLQD